MSLMLYWIQHDNVMMEMIQHLLFIIMTTATKPNPKHREQNEVTLYYSSCRDICICFTKSEDELILYRRKTLYLYLSI